MAASRQKPLPDSWAAPLYEHLTGSRDVIRAALTALNQLSDGKLDDKTIARLITVAREKEMEADIRLRSLNSLPQGSREIDPAALHEREIFRSDGLLAGPVRRSAKAILRRERHRSTTRRE